MVGHGRQEARDNEAKKSDGDLRDEFRAACRAQDIPAAQVIRTFMREYVAKYAEGQIAKKKHKAGAKSGNAEE